MPPASLAPRAPPRLAEAKAQPKQNEEAVLTEDQVSVVEKTWKQAAALGAETVGVLLFKQIFDIAPQALQLFPFKDDRELYDSPRLKGHGVKVVTTVDAVIKGVRDLEGLKPTLQNLGLRHVGYGVLPPHYDVVGQALLRTLKLGLQDAFTKEVEAAWSKLWVFVAKWCIAGNYPEQKPEAAENPTKKAAKALGPPSSLIGGKRAGTRRWRRRSWWSSRRTIEGEGYRHRDWDSILGGHEARRRRPARLGSTISADELRRVVVAVVVGCRRVTTGSGGPRE